MLLFFGIHVSLKSLRREIDSGKKCAFRRRRIAVCGSGGFVVVVGGGGGVVVFVVEYYIILIKIVVVLRVPRTSQSAAEGD